jgi:hypothetical protein
LLGIAVATAACAGERWTLSERGCSPQRAQVCVVADADLGADLLLADGERLLPGECAVPSRAGARALHFRVDDGERRGRARRIVAKPRGTTILELGEGLGVRRSRERCGRGAA